MNGKAVGAADLYMYLLLHIMKQLLSFRTAVYSTVTILSLIILFHILVITGVIPFGIVWGGRLTNHQQMVQFETTSILINLVMISIVATKAGWLIKQMNERIINILLWLMVGLFTLNTIGNIFAENKIEAIIFTPMTFLLAIFCIRMALEKKS